MRNIYWEICYKTEYDLGMGHVVKLLFISKIYKLHMMALFSIAKIYKPHMFWTNPLQFNK